MAGARIDCEQYLAFSPCFAHCHKGGALFCKWMATLGINPCLAHCQFQESIVPRVSRVPHVPLAVCKLRSSALCQALFRLLSKREAPLTPRCTRLGEQYWLSALALRSPNCLRNRSHQDFHCTFAAQSAALRRGSAARSDRRFTTNSATERGEARQETRERTDDWTHQAPPRRWRPATGGIPP